MSSSLKLRLGISNIEEKNWESAAKSKWCSVHEELQAKSLKSYKVDASVKISSPALSMGPGN